MGNNGIWALEHHPMKFLYGYSVAAELRRKRATTSWSRRWLRGRDRQGSRTSSVRRWELPPSAWDADLVNVITDPEIAYPRKWDPSLRTGFKKRNPHTDRRTPPAHVVDSRRCRRCHHALR